MLHESYKNSSTLFQNLKPIHIVVPVSDRNKFIDNLLLSIKSHLEAFNFPHSLIAVHLINDSHDDINREELWNFNFDVQVRNISDQIKELLTTYWEDRLKTVYGTFIKPLPQNKEKRERKWSGSTMNVGRLLLNKIMDKKNDIVWFIDSDEEFSILTKDTNSFKVVPHAFSAFHSLEEIFQQYNPDIVTGKITWDPAFSAPQMIRTQLIDLLADNKDILPVHAYHHENRAYNDLSLFSQAELPRNYSTGYPLLPFEDRWILSNHPAHSILLGHHISRPICYSNPDALLHDGSVDRKVYIGDIIWPGNVAGTHKLLRFPSPFVESKIRLSGPILGKLITKMGESIHTANIPTYHRRISDINDLGHGFRGGTTHKEDLIDISSLRAKQIEGDIIAKYLDKCGQRYNTIDRNLFSEVSKEVFDLYKKQMQDIQELVKQIDWTNDYSLWFLKKSLLYSLEHVQKHMSDDIINSLNEILHHLNSFTYDLEKRNKLIDSI